jgi:hypothetical protein
MLTPLLTTEIHLFAQHASSTQCEASVGPDDMCDFIERAAGLDRDDYQSRCLQATLVYKPHLLTVYGVHIWTCCQRWHAGRRAVGNRETFPLSSATGKGGPAWSPLPASWLPSSESA